MSDVCSKFQLHHIWHYTSPLFSLLQTHKYEEMQIHTILFGITAIISLLQFHITHAPIKSLVQRFFQSQNKQFEIRFEFIIADSNRII